MKTKNVLFWACVCIIAVTTVAIAAEEAKQTTTGQQGVRAVQRPQLQRPMPGRGIASATAADPNAPRAANREDAFREAMNRRMESSRAEVAKLQAILKIAEEEKATKTVEALKALIAEKEKAAKDQIEQAERRRQEMQQRIQQRAGQAATGETPAGADQVRPEDAKATPRQGQGGAGARGQQRQQAK